MKNWKIYSTKTSMVWRQKPYFNSFHRIWRTYGWQMSCSSRRLHEENQLRFSNSKHCRFYWTTLKTMRLGVLSWGKLNNRETYGRIMSLDQLESRRAIADLFVMFFTWRVKKLQKFVNVCLKVGYSANLKHSKSTWRQLIAPWKRIIS